MNVIVDTIAKVAGLQPPSLRSFPSQCSRYLCGLTACKHCGNRSQQDAKCCRCAGKDQDTIRRIAGEASGLIGACAQDLIGLAMELASRAVPLAVGLLVPHPLRALALRQP